jgi:hypothetical protein
MQREKKEKKNIAGESNSLKKTRAAVNQREELATSQYL